MGHEKLNIHNTIEKCKEEDMLHILACTRYVTRLLAQKAYLYTFYSDRQIKFINPN